jgi:hypothetical protein
MTRKSFSYFKPIWLKKIQNRNIRFLQKKVYLLYVCKLFYTLKCSKQFSQLELVLILDIIQLLFVAHAFTVMSGYHQHQDQNLTIDLRLFESMFYKNKIFSKNITI